MEEGTDAWRREVGGDDGFNTRQSSLLNSQGIPHSWSPFDLMCVPACPITQSPPGLGSRERSLTSHNTMPSPCLISKCQSSQLRTPAHWVQHKWAQIEEWQWEGVRQLPSAILFLINISPRFGRASISQPYSVYWCNLWLLMFSSMKQYYYGRNTGITVFSVSYFCSSFSHKVQPLTHPLCTALQSSSVTAIHDWVFFFFFAFNSTIATWKPFLNVKCILLYVQYIFVQVTCLLLFVLQVLLENLGRWPCSKIRTTLQEGNKKFPIWTILVVSR